MSLIFMDGFDANDLNLKWVPLGNATASSATTRFGTGMAMNTNNVGVVAQWTTGTAQMFIGFAYYMTSSSATGGVVFWSNDGATACITVNIGPTLIALKSGNNGSTLSSTAVSLSANTWYYVEIMATLATSGGQCQVNIGGVTQLNFTGNTQQSGTNGVVDRIYLQEFNGINVLFDDMYICNSLGATNNTFLGDVRVQTLLPAAAGSSTQFSPTGSVNNWQNADDVPDSSTTYNSASTVGQRDTYRLGSTLASTGTIFGVQDNVHCFKLNSGSANIKAALKSGGTVYYDPVQVLSPTDLWSGAIRETDPSTSLTWSPPNVNNVEFGAEVA